MKRYVKDPEEYAREIELRKHLHQVEDHPGDDWHLNWYAGHREDEGLHHHNVEPADPNTLPPKDFIKNNIRDLRILDAQNRKKRAAAKARAELEAKRLEEETLLAKRRYNRKHGIITDRPEIEVLLPAGVDLETTSFQIAFDDNLAPTVELTSMEPEEDKKNLKKKTSTVEKEKMKKKVRTEQKKRVEKDSREKLEKGSTEESRRLQYSVSGIITRESLEEVVSRHKMKKYAYAESDTVSKYSRADSIMTESLKPSEQDVSQSQRRELTERELQRKKIRDMLKYL